MRKLMVAGNWKMNGDRASISSLIEGLVAGVAQNGSIDILVCPPAVYLQQVSEALNGSLIKAGVQNISQYQSGAYTGETALPMLADFGCQYTLVGHSERRAMFAETDQQVADKCLAALDAGVTPILCVGETLEERDAGNAVAVVASQIKAVLDVCGFERVADLVIAYEPVWAIGTGRTASPEQAQEIHAAIRAQLAEADADVAAATRLLYGGSVNAANAAELFAQQDIDGGLVGGASLKVNEFLSICSAAAAVNQAV